MRRFAFVVVLTLLMMIPLTTKAQLFGDPIRDRASWAFEASVFGNLTHRDLTQMNDHLSGAPEYFLGPANVELVPGVYRYQDLRNQQQFEDFLAYEFRLGFRFQNFHVGMSMTQMPEETGGYELEAIDGIMPYELKVSARDYSAYVGYLYPINHWLSVGPMVSYGFGTITGSLTDFDTDVDGGELFGSYTPFRAELRGRIQLTRYITVDIGGGIRSATVTDLEADYGVDGVGGLLDGRNAVWDFEDNVIELDFSGWYIGGGITLLNPMGLN